MRICSACGHALTPDGPCGFASITVGEKTTYLCHADDHSCYMGAAADPGKMTSGMGARKGTQVVNTTGLPDGYVPPSASLSPLSNQPLPDAAEGDGETDEQIAQILAMPCVMFQQEPFDFAWCEIHDETFPLGDVCRYHPTYQGGQR